MAALPGRHRLAPLDERFGRLLDRRVVADVALDPLRAFLVVGGAVLDGAGVVADLEPGVVPQEADAPRRELAPELVVDPLQGADDRRAGRDRRGAQQLAADPPPPGVRL